MRLQPSPRAHAYFFGEKDSSKWPKDVAAEWSAIVHQAYQEGFDSVPYSKCTGSGAFYPSICQCQNCTAARAAEKRQRELQTGEEFE